MSSDKQYQGFFGTLRRESERRKLWKEIALDEKQEGLLSYARHKLDSHLLEFTNEAAWNGLRKSVVQQDPRREYILDCAERWGKKIQVEMKKYGQRPVDDIAFTKIARSCKDFAFVLDDFSGEDVRLAVSFLSNTIRYGDRIKNWYSKEVNEPQLVNGKIYLEWGASSRKDTPAEAQARIPTLEQQKRDRIAFRRKGYYEGLKRFTADPKGATEKAIRIAWREAASAITVFRKALNEVPKAMEVKAVVNVVGNRPRKPLSKVVHPFRYGL